MRRRLRTTGRGSPPPRPARPRMPGSATRSSTDVRSSDIVLALLGLTMLGATCLAIAIALLGRVLGT